MQEKLAAFRVNNYPNNKMSFYGISVHIGIKGNERADKLPKSADTLKPMRASTPEKK